MQNELDIVRDVSRRLDGGGLAYMLTGSMAMNYYAQPRMTRDIDLVVALAARDVDTIRGIGSGMLATLVAMAASLKIETIWGEATASSAPFYERVLESGPVEDLFVIRRKTMQRILRR